MIDTFLIGIWIFDESLWTLPNKCLAQDMARVDLSHFASSFWSGAEGQDTKRDSCVAMMAVMQDAFALETRCPAPTPSRLCYYRKNKRESLSVPLRLLSFCSSGNRGIGISQCVSAEVIEWMQWMLVLIHLDRHHHRYSPKCREGSNGVSAAPRSVQKPGSLAMLLS